MAPLQVPQVVRCNGACKQEIQVWANYPIEVETYECGSCQEARTNAAARGFIVPSPRARRAAFAQLPPLPQAVTGDVPHDLNVQIDLDETAAFLRGTL